MKSVVALSIFLSLVLAGFASAALSASAGSYATDSYYSNTPTDSSTAPSAIYVGDVTMDGKITQADAEYIIAYILSGGPKPDEHLADADCSGTITISDAVYIINFVNANGPAPGSKCNSATLAQNDLVVAKRVVTTPANQMTTIDSAANENVVAYVKGDADSSGIVDLNDAVYLQDYIFSGGPAPNPLNKGDADCSGTITISDVVYIVNYVKAKGPAPGLKCATIDPSPIARSGGSAGGSSSGSSAVIEMPPTPPSDDSTSISTCKQTMVLQKGWNMISYPCGAPIKVIENTCTSKQTMRYANGRYEESAIGSAVSSAVGYWYKAETPCKITVVGTQNIKPMELKSGWNQIGSPSKTVNLKQVIGSCEVASGPYEFNPSANKYTASEVLKVGFGYWIKVANPCSFVYDSEVIPPLPDEPEPTIIPPAAASIILHRKHLNCKDSTPYEPAMKGQKEQVFPVGPGTGYTNYRCKNRYQEQCVDDGSFDTYYDEWCEYPIATIAPSAWPKPTIVPVPISSPRPTIVIGPSIIPYPTTIITPMPVECKLFRGDGTYQLNIGCKLMTDDGHTVRMVDVSSFAPRRAQMEIYNSDGKLVRTIYLGDGEEARISEANDLYIQVNGFTDAGYGKISGVKITVKSGVLTPSIIPDCKYQYGDGNFILYKNCQVMSSNGYMVKLIEATPTKYGEAANAMIEVTSNGVLIKVLFLKVGDYATISEAGDLFLQVLDISSFEPIAIQISLKAPVPTPYATAIPTSITTVEYPVAKVTGGGGSGSGGYSYKRGDANKDGLLDLDDATYITNYIFNGGPAPDPLAIGDADCSKSITISDSVFIINYVKSGGPAPCALDLTSPIDTSAVAPRDAA